METKVAETKVEVQKPNLISYPVPAGHVRCEKLIGGVLTQQDFSARVLASMGIDKDGENAGTYNGWKPVNSPVTTATVSSPVVAAPVIEETEDEEESED